MNIIKLKTKADGKDDVKVLVIYTGGTLGMVYDAKSDSLVPFDFAQIPENLPEMSRLDFEISVLTFDNLLDSSNMNPKIWVQLANIIADNYTYYDSFVILHGTDTMAYTASALSYLLEDLNKPVILTGAQLPIGVARTDAKENFITALEIAAAQTHNRPIISEVCIYFNSVLLRGNRARKNESVQFNAFESENYPVLAEAGIKIEYNKPYLKHYDTDAQLKVHQTLDENVIILKLFPGITEKVVRNVLEIRDLRGVVLETYGSGNAPTTEWFLKLMKEFIEKGIIIYNVSQCNGGRVSQGRYQTSQYLQEIGVVSGADITTEAAITKLMFALGQSNDIQTIKKILRHSIAGEMA
ncbi:MAG: asparaginase [Arcicella sp.]|jgi:L-asparaginase|nr:asparaginase [Arcicella sp.]